MLRHSLYIVSLLSIAYAQFKFEECGVTKTCLMKPPGCKTESDCIDGTSFKPISDNQLEIEMFGAFNSSQNVYIAAAFGVECQGRTYMINTFATECSSIGKETGPTAKLSYNNARPDNERITDQNKEISTKVLSQEQILFQDKVLYCRMKQRVTGHGVQNPKILNVDKSAKYFLLLAKGDTNQHGLLRHHHSAIVSKVSYDLFGNPGNNTFALPSCPTRSPQQPPTTQSTKTSATTFLSLLSVIFPLSLVF